MANKRVGDVIYNNYDQYTGKPFNTKIASTLPDGTVITDDHVDNAVVFKNKAEFGGGYSLRSDLLSDGYIKASWFGAKEDGVTDNTAQVQKAIDVAEQLKCKVQFNNGVYLFKEPIHLKSSVGLVGDKNTVFKCDPSGFTTDRGSLLYIFNCHNASVKNITLVLSGESSPASVATGIFLSNATYNTIEDVTINDFGSTTGYPSSGVLRLVAKDTEEMFDGGQVGPCSFNVFRNLTIEQNTASTSSFGIRCMTNWVDQIPHENFVNKTEGNLFENITVKGDYLWNMLEFAGGGTVGNKVTNSFFTGRSITAIDFDKGASWNEAVGNTIDGLRLSEDTEEAVPDGEYVFFAIHNHGSNPYRAIGNKIVNNRIRNVGSVIDDDVREAAIGLQYTNNALVSNNYIDGLTGICNGVVIMNDVVGANVSNNEITTPRRGIRCNPSGAGNVDISILGNTINSEFTSIQLEGSGGTSEKFVISNNVCNSGDQVGINVNGIWDSGTIIGNTINNTTDKVSIASTNTVIASNLLKGNSSYSIRLRESSNAIISANMSAQFTNGIVASGTSSMSEFQNSWNPNPVPNSPYFRNDNVKANQDGSVIPEDYFLRTGITQTSITSGVNYPSSTGVVFASIYAGAPTRSFEIFKEASTPHRMWYRSFGGPTSPSVWLRIPTPGDPVPDSAPTPGETYSQAGMTAILTELRALKASLVGSGALEA